MNGEWILRQVKQNMLGDLNEAGKLKMLLIELKLIEKFYNFTELQRLAWKTVLEAAKPIIE